MPSQLAIEGYQSMKSGRLGPSPKMLLMLPTFDLERRKAKLQPERIDRNRLSCTWVLLFINLTAQYGAHCVIPSA